VVALKALYVVKCSENILLCDCDTTNISFFPQHLFLPAHISVLSLVLWKIIEVDWIQ
jgi:hypothetical protein